MSTAGAKSANTEVALRAEAGAWLARLHGPNRTAQVEEGFRAWMNESPAHAAAFEHMTDTWEKAARLRRRPIEHVASWELPGFRLSFSRAAIAAAVIAVLAISGTLFYLQSDAIATAVGEQRILALEDGSRVYLNTDTRATVHFDKATRRVELDRGEALFEVAKHPDRPFIVVAGDRQIKALGTSFIVRREEENLAVTLVEGKVAVLSSPPPQAGEGRVGVSSITLSPGQRLTLNASRSPRLDRPALDKMTAWQRGQVALDNSPLLEAVAEMNRYSRKQLIVESPRAANIRISGIFRSGDSENFAQAVSKNYGLEVVKESSRIVLMDLPVTGSEH